MKLCRSVIWLVVLSTVLRDVSSGWLDKVGRELQRFGNTAGNQLKKAGEDVGAEYKRFEDRAGKEVHRWESQAGNAANTVEAWFHGTDEAALVSVSTSYQDTVGNKCPPLGDPSMAISCHLAGVVVNCSEPVAVGTTADLQCNEGYVFASYPGYDSVTCNATCNWSNPVAKCVPDCGRLNSPNGGLELIAGGDLASEGEFPWHVGIYRLNASQLYDQVCGGTLVSPSLIISAAQCFWNNSQDKPVNAHTYKVAVGKYSRDWYTPDALTQQRDVAEIIVHERFLGQRRNLVNDIAMVRVSEDVVLSSSVNTACMDWQGDTEAVQLVNGNSGAVAGWGLAENNTFSSELRSVRLPFLSFSKCSDVVADDFLRYLTHDKICGGWRNKGTSVCRGDLGGGYLFPVTSETATRYYLRGVASAVHEPPSNSSSTCHTEQVCAFTLVSAYKQWIEKIVYA